MLSSEEVRLDAAELTRLQSLAVRPRVKDLLAAELVKLKTEHAAAFENVTEPANETVVMSLSEQPAVKREPAAPRRYTVQVNTYAWDQTDKFMKIYVTVSGVVKLPKDSIKVTFTATSFKLLVEHTDNKDVCCHVGDLYGRIIPDKSYHKVKSDDTVLLMLKKAEEKTWAYVTQREGKTAEEKKKSTKYDDKKDPNAGLMDMMKKMYDEGDDEMKRTISKAWTESRDKRPAGKDF